MFTVDTNCLVRIICQVSPISSWGQVLKIYSVTIRSAMGIGAYTLLAVVGLVSRVDVSHLFIQLISEGFPFTLKENSSSE
jgi:hypothetical protein